MNNTQAEKVHEKASLHNAFIFYRPPSGLSKEQLFYSQEAWQIISMDEVSPEEKPEKKKDVLSYMSSLCSKWKKIIEKGHDELSPHKGSADSIAGHIAILESYRRRYMVNCITLSGHTSKSNSTEQTEKQYLFVLERITLEKINLPMIFRQYKLNNREQDIVRLLFAGNSNKEIALNLSLSPNTVKAYMKFLTLKLGVNNRAGIISVLLAGKAMNMKTDH